MDQLLAPIGIDLWTVLVAILNTLVLTLFLKKFFFQKIKDVIDSRDKEISDMYLVAKSTQDDVLNLKKTYEDNISNAKDKALEIVNQATITANKRSEEIVNQANLDATNLKEKAFSTIELEKKKAVLDIKQEISNLVIDASSKVLEKELNKETHKQLIDDFISEV